MEPRNNGQPRITKKDVQLSSSIMHSIEIDSAFRLYSHHIISPEQFIERTKELIDLYNSNLRTKATQKEPTI